MTVDGAFDGRGVKGRKRFSVDTAGRSIRNRIGGNKAAILEFSNHVILLLFCVPDLCFQSCDLRVHTRLPTKSDI